MLLWMFGGHLKMPLPLLLFVMSSEALFRNVSQRSHFVCCVYQQDTSTKHKSQWLMSHKEVSLGAIKRRRREWGDEWVTNAASGGPCMSILRFQSTFWPFSNIHTSHDLHWPHKCRCFGLKIIKIIIKIIYKSLSEAPNVLSLKYRQQKVTITLLYSAACVSHWKPFFTWRVSLGDSMRH